MEDGEKNLVHYNDTLVIDQRRKNKKRKIPSNVLENWSNRIDEAIYNAIKDKTGI